MRHVLLYSISILLVFLLIDCKKKKEKEPDKIEYHDPSDIVIQPNGDYSIDFDQNGTTDFVFNANTRYFYVGSASTTSTSCTTIDAKPVGSNNICGNFLGEGGIIDRSNTFTDFIQFYSSGGLYCISSGCFSGDIYIGVLIDNNYAGWIRVEGFCNTAKIIVKDMAVNKTEGNYIRAGQTQ